MNSISIDPTQADILIVDDTPQNLRLLARMLSKRGYSVRAASDGPMALQAAQTSPPDLILLDVMMPGMDGYQVCQRLKDDAHTADIPVIFLSALTQIDDKIKAFSVGGLDYITKPFQIEEVLARVQNHLALRYAQRQVRQLNSELEHRVQQRTSQLEKTNQQLKREIIEHKRTQERLMHMAFHDALTELPNRALFLERLHHALVRMKEEGDYLFAVLLLDCDRFKVINDSLGHSTGDRLLKALARRLETCLTMVDTVARLGGDEFAILLEEITDLDTATQISEQILTEISNPFHISGYDVYLNASMGIVLGNEECENPENLLRDADTALHRAKALGKGQYHLFDPLMHQFALQRLQLESDLRQAMDRQGFMVYYQPIIALKTGKISGFEALVRWNHSTRGLISPGEFIPVAEETGLITALGIWVLREACYQLCTWHQQNLVEHPLTISINLSVRQIAQRNLIEQVDQLLAETKLKPQSIKLEITESALMENGDAVIGILHQLRDRGIQLSIDDFGTGYSSLSYLHRLPVDTLKIDQSFVRRMDTQSGNMGLVPAIINMAHTLGIDAIAEGVETLQQLEQLRLLNCDFGQGFFFGQAINSQAATDLMRSNPQW
jgi:diguanylate cyclase (GGDEF)-like protein